METHDRPRLRHSLAVVANLLEKSKGEFVYSFSEAEHTIMPHKKNPH